MGEHTMARLLLQVQSPNRGQGSRSAPEPARTELVAGDDLSVLTDRAAALTRALTVASAAGVAARGF